MIKQSHIVYVVRSEHRMIARTRRILIFDKMMRELSQGDGTGLCIPGKT